MSDDRCSFPEPILNGGFRCAKGENVVRRAGPDIACQSAASSARCGYLLAQLKAVGLPFFDCQDDLLTTPHSVIMKIKSGGLLGLQALLTEESTQVADIDGLLDAASNHYGEIQSIPYEQCRDAMKLFSVRRRSRRE